MKGTAGDAEFYLLHSFILEWLCVALHLSGVVKTHLVAIE